MIILELIPDICTIGGGQTLTKNLSISISKQRKDIKIIIVSLYKRNTSPVVDDLEKHKIPIIYLNKKRGIDFKCARELKKLVDTIQPNYVHAHLNTILTIYLSKIFKKHIIYYTFHSVLLKKVTFSEKINNLIIKKLIKNHAIVPIAISPVVANTISDYLGIKKPPIILNGIDTNVFRPSESFFNRRYDFAVVGSFSSVKNQRQILQILFSIYKKGYSFNAVFLGDGPTKNECKEYAKNNGLDKFIEFKGNVGDVFNYLKDSYFLLMKSLYEGNPMVINESISCGTFVISNNVGGIPDIVDCSTGYIVDKNDDIAFEEAIIYSLINKNKILKRVKSRLEENRNRVSIDKLSLQYLELFEGGYNE